MEILRAKPIRGELLLVALGVLLMHWPIRWNGSKLDKLQRDVMKFYLNQARPQPMLASLLKQMGWRSDEEGPFDSYRWWRWGN